MHTLTVKRGALGFGLLFPVFRGTQSFRMVHADGVMKKVSGGVCVAEASKNGNGEDAMFIQARDIGVFDGVGGWRDQGIDPGIYSRQLADGVSDYITMCRKVDADADIDLAKALDVGAETCVLNKLTGSSTACIATLDEKIGSLRTINLGDSGLVMFRREGGNVKVSHKAEITTLGFNFPRQIGNIADPKLGQIVSDTSKNAKYDVFQLLSGDVSVMASDGIWDNLFDEDICRILEQSVLFGANNDNITQRDLEVVSKEIVLQATKKAADEKSITPWSKSVVKHYKQRYAGGKPDDMTVVVSYFTK